MKLDPERLKKVLDTESEEYTRIISQIWKEGRKRAIVSTAEAGKLDRENAKSKLR
jgi:hypothetical protein